jgi:hypothetical protein
MTALAPLCSDSNPSSAGSNALEGQSHVVEAAGTMASAFVP